jgi:hypothetical protein
VWLLEIYELPDEDTAHRNLLLAAGSGTPAIFDLLLSYGSHGFRIYDASPLSSAVASTREDTHIIPMMIHLLHLGVDVDGLGYLSNFHPPLLENALYCAVRGRHTKRAELLLEYGADPFTEGTPTSPYDLATENDLTEILEIFPAKG